MQAKPISKRAEDPERVSFHIHRIGYHFKSEVLEEACTELGYIYHRDRFVKETDLLQQHRDNALAQTLAKYGLRHNPLKDAQGANARESPEVVAAAIKELFPRIQDADLDMIVKHAWAEGSDRVGTNAELGLPRRVQLAVIARIRHTYTDYDTLLRVFDWSDARILVEPDCLKKLIEWRGETEDDDDNVFEEIVRETIVIDDEEEEDGVRRRGSEADDEDSARELEPGGASETELEITHHEVTDIDVGAESVDERTRRYIGVPPVRRSQKLQERSNIARQKIGAARQRLRNGEPPKAYAMVPAPQLPVGPANGEGRTNGAAHTQQSGYDQYGERVWKDGQWFRKVSGPSTFARRPMLLTPFGRYRCKLRYLNRACSRASIRCNRAVRTGHGHSSTVYKLRLTLQRRLSAGHRRPRIDQYNLLSVRIVSRMRIHPRRQVTMVDR